MAATDALQALAQVLRTAPQPVTLSESLLSGAGATPPQGLDAALAKAFRSPGANGLGVTFGPDAVQPVAGDALQVLGARLATPFLGVQPAGTAVTLRFRQGPAAVEVLVAVALDGWSWDAYFPYMSGRPFDLLPVSRPSFVFTTEPTAWPAPGGGTAALVPGQNFVASTTLPGFLGTLLAAVGLAPPSGVLPFYGPVGLDRADVVAVDGGTAEPQDEPAVLYPDADLRAHLPGSPEVFFLRARDAVVGLLVETAAETGADDGPPSDEDLRAAAPTEYVQTPLLLLAASFDLGTHTGADVTLDLRAPVDPDGRLFGFTLLVDPDSEARLTPSAALALLGGAGESFLALVPAPLQEALALVGFEGLSLQGALQPSVALVSAGMSLASTPGHRLVLFGDPVSGTEFAIGDFRVAWRVMDPLAKAPRRPVTTVTVSASVDLWPAVFHGPFEVSVDQDLRIAGAFSGSVALSDILRAVTGGAVALPEGVEAAVSDVEVVIDPAARSYSLAWTLDVELGFARWEGRPLLSVDGARFQLGAVTPPGGAGRTAFRASAAGSLAVGPLLVSAALGYDGTATPPVWRCRAALSEPLALSDLVGALFPEVAGDGLPAFLPRTVRSFALDAVLPVGQGGTPRYSLSGAVAWDLSAYLPAPAQVEAQLGLQYDAAGPEGSRFSGQIVGRITVASAVPFDLMVGYRFGAGTAAAPPASSAVTSPVPLAGAPSATDQAGSRVLWVQWEGVRGAYDLVNSKATLTLVGWSAGSLLRALMRTAGDPEFQLPSPWDVLDKVPLDGLKLVVDLGEGAPSPFYATYDLPARLDLGFLRVTGLTFRRGAGGKVMIAFEGSTTIRSLASSPLFDPRTGQDVTSMPAVPGKGADLVDLRLLVLGQRIAVGGADGPRSVAAVVRALEAVPPTTGPSLPLDPATPAPGQPSYEPSAGWLAALDLGLLRDPAGGYAVDVKLVLADPDLYGLRLAFKGPKTKILDGLVIDVDYHKVTDEVGLFETEVTLPDALRTFDVGAFTVTVPVVRVQIYTNGDFLLDLGFPRGLDFSRSFTLRAVVPPGIPVLGSAGLYVGRLSAGGGGAGLLPRGVTGTFSPAFAFGVGLQFGIGYSVVKGPLRAGFGVTVCGIVEGVIAAWHPDTTDALTSAPALAESAALQGDYYFRLSGTLAIVGRLYGTVDLAVVKADLQVTAILATRVVYESFGDITVSVSASVDVRLTVRIDLGLFTVSVSLSFSAVVTAEVTLPGRGTPPWLPPGARRRAGRGLSRALPPAAANPVPVLRPVRRAGGDRPVLRLHTAPQYTVLTAPGATRSDTEGAMVFLLAMDAPVAGVPDDGSGSSFEGLCRTLFAWVLDAVLVAGTDVTDPQATEAVPATAGQLVDALAWLSSPGGVLGEEDVERLLLAAAFDVRLDAVTSQTDPSDTGRLAAGATVFPAFAGLDLVVPASGGGDGGDLTIPLSRWATIDVAYRRLLESHFAQLAARVAEEEGAAGAAGSAVPQDQEALPLARFVFEDWFALVARQLVQAAADVLADYRLPLDGTETLGDLVTRLNTLGNGVGASDLAESNAARPLPGGLSLTIPAVPYTVQPADSLGTIAARCGGPGGARAVTPADLVTANAGVPGAVAPGLDIAVGAIHHVTQPGESFNTLASALGVDLGTLAAEAPLWDRTDLLAPGAQLTVPPSAYRTSQDAADTLAGLAGRFDLTLPALVDANTEVPGLFGMGEVRVAGLDVLTVGELWQALSADGRVAQTAAMAARFALHGTRLPAGDGLVLPAAFPSPAAPEYGLYQLTGQQFPVPARFVPPPDAPSDAAAPPPYSIRVTKDTSLDWLLLGTAGAAPGREPSGGDALEVDLTESARRLRHLLAWTREHGYDPDVLAVPEPDVTTEPRRYAAAAVTAWSTADEARLAELTAPPGVLAGVGTVAAAGPQTRPLLVDLPRGLLSLAGQRQAAASAGLAAADLLTYLPVVQPQSATADPAVGRTTFTPVERWAAATRVRFQVRRMPDPDAQSRQTPQANDVVPPGPGNAGARPPLAPFTYELIGPAPADAVVLRRLLSTTAARPGAVADLFLLLPAPDSGPAEFSSHPHEELLAFLTSTNLSTATRPDTGAGLGLTAGPPRGIANPPEEFLRLLWEASAVRSGGFFLHYETSGDAGGLPDRVFDADGTATLTLLAVHDRSLSPPDGVRLLDSVNALLVAEPVDTSRSVLTFLSRSAPRRSLPLPAPEPPTLAGIAALYGTDEGLLAALNGDLPLADGTLIPLAGVLHRVSDADAATGDPLAAVARRYSNGAADELGPDRLRAYNPGVDPVPGAVLRIPPLAYVCGSADEPGPGVTLASVGAWYGLTPDAVGAAARGTAPFPPGTRLVVDPQERDPRPGTGTGNVGVRLTRAVAGEPGPLPQDPTSAQVEEFALAQLDQLYSLLSTAILPTVFAAPSPYGLPFGPRRATTAGQPSDAPALAGAHPDAATGDQHYTFAFGLTRHATLNAAPEPAGPALPPRAGNPYAGTGGHVLPALRWLDLFGNTLSTPFDAQPPALTGPRAAPPLPVLYSDDLIGLDRWPAAAATYTCAGEPGSPLLQVTFAFSPAAYEEPAPDRRPGAGTTAGTPDWQSAARADLPTYTRLYYQLNQDYDPLQVPGLAGQAVAMSLTCTLLAAPRIDLDGEQAGLVRSFVSGCVSYLARRAAGEAADPPAPAVLRVPLSTGAVTTDEVFALSVAFTLERRPEQCDPVLRVLPGGTSATAAVIPEATGGDADPALSLRAFATALESAVRTDTWTLRVGTSAPDPATDGGAARPLWAVRMGSTPGAGLGYRIGDTPAFYAPRPLSLTLADDSGPVPRYAGADTGLGAGVETSFTGVDLNAWAAQALEAVDTFLGPGCTGPALVLDRLTGVADPERDGSLARLLRAKKTLASAIAHTVTPLLAESPDDPAGREAAAGTLEQALLDRLGVAYTVSAVAVFEVTEAHSAAPPPVFPGAAPPRFYGQPIGEPVVAATSPQDTGSERGFSLSSAKIPTTRADDGASRLAFLFDSAKVSTAAHVPLALSYAMTHLEHDIHPVPGIDGYQSSRWITFVNGPFVTPIAGGRPVDFPIPLRSLPQPPTATAQTATATATGPADPADPAALVHWAYTFDYVHSDAAQDSVTVTLDLGGTEPLAVSGAEDPGHVLFLALAGMTANAPAILADLAAWLRPIDGRTQPLDPAVPRARRAVDAFVTLAEQLADAFEAWSAQPSPYRPRSAANGARYEFETVLVDDGGRARVDVIAPDGAPEPVVRIDPAVWNAVEAAPGPGARYAWAYVRRDDPAVVMDYSTALAVPARTIAWTGLDVLAVQSARTSVRVLRNRHLVEGTVTADAFRLATPSVAFADAAVPLLRWPRYDLGTVPPAGGAGTTACGARLAAFFGALFAGAEGQTVLVKMSASYRYRLTQEDDPPPTVLPIALLPATAVPAVPSPLPPAVEALASRVEDWLAEERPLRDATAALTFALEVFSGADVRQSMPLVVVEDLYLAQIP
jgi:hypothetical protein